MIPAGRASSQVLVTVQEERRRDNGGRGRDVAAAALKVEEGAPSQGLQVASGSQDGQETVSLGPLEGISPAAQRLDFSPVRPSLAPAIHNCEMKDWCCLQRYICGD